MFSSVFGSSKKELTNYAKRKSYNYMTDKSGMQQKQVNRLGCNHIKSMWHLLTVNICFKELLKLERNRAQKQGRSLIPIFVIKHTTPTVRSLTSLNRGSGIAERSMGLRSVMLTKHASSTVMAHST